MGPVYDSIARILHGETGQTVVHVPPLRVSSATYTIQDLTRDEDASDRVLGVADSAATLDSYSETTTGAAGPGQADPRSIPVTPTGITVGAVYELSDAVNGVSQYVTVAGTKTAAVKLTAPLTRAYASGSTLRGVQLSASFPDASAASDEIMDEDRPLAIRWEYTVLGRKRVHDQQVRVVRRTDSDVDVGRIEEWIRTDWPDLFREAPQDGAVLRNWIHSSRRRIEARMMAEGIDPTRLLAGPQGNELTYLRTLLHMADQGLHPMTRDPEAFRSERKDDYAKAWNILFSGTAGVGTVDVTRAGNQATGTTSRRYGAAFGTA